MPKIRNLPPDFDVVENWEELKILIESIDRDLKKSVTKGTKQPGINARKGIMYAKELLTNIYHGSIKEQKKIRENRPKHGNSEGAGIKAMHESRDLKNKHAEAS